MFDIAITRTADKAMRRIPAEVAHEFRSLFRTVAAAPFAKHAKVIKMRGFKDTFRIRVRDWRAVYRVDRKSQALLIVDVRKRGEAYR